MDVFKKAHLEDLKMLSLFNKGKEKDLIFKVKRAPNRILFSKKKYSVGNYYKKNGIFFQITDMKKIEGIYSYGLHNDKIMKELFK